MWEIIPDLKAWQWVKKTLYKACLELSTTEFNGLIHPLSLLQWRAWLMMPRCRRSRGLVVVLEPLHGPRPNNCKFANLVRELAKPARISETWSSINAVYHLSASTSHKDEALIVSSIPFFNIEKSAVSHSNRLCDSKVLCLPTTISFQAVVRWTPLLFLRFTIHFRPEEWMHCPHTYLPVVCDGWMHLL